MRQSWANEFVGESPAPSFVSIDPDSGLDGGGTGVTIVISGFDANDTSEIRFGCDAQGFGGDIADDLVALNSTTLTCTTPPAGAGPGVVNVSVVAVTATVVGLGVYTYL